MVKKGLTAAGFLCLFVIAALSLNRFRPSVIITNETGESVYVFASEGLHNIEPSPEEMKKIMRTAPEVVEPGGRLKITPSLWTAITPVDELNVGWLIGGRYSYHSIGGGQQRFSLSSDKGICSMTLRVMKGRNHFLLDNNQNGVCFKKLTPLTIEY